MIPGLGKSLGGGINYSLQYSWASLITQMVKNLPAVRETWVRFLGCEDPIKEGMATHSSILAGDIPWTEQPDQAIVQGIAKNWATKHSIAQIS